MSLIKNIIKTKLWIQIAMIFFFSLFIIMGLTIPGLQINDEWITANQLHQLVEGHQVLTSEGKYGSYLGDISQYFAIRGNILGYSLLLPIFATGPMLLFMTLGEYFRFVIIFFWSLIPVLIALIMHLYHPEYSRILKMPIFIPAMVISLVLLSLNLFFYYPFPASFLTDPLESASLVFTANILFSILCVILYLIGREIFHHGRVALFVAIMLTACSSFIYWGTSGKDHILSIVLVALCLLFLFRYINNNSRISAGLGFFFLGITAWVRPELGLSLFFMFGFFFIVVSLSPVFNVWNFREYLFRIAPIFAFFAGLIPFFINNYLITGNPLLSPYFMYYIPTGESAGAEIINRGMGNGSSITSSATSSGFSIDHIFKLFFEQYTLNSPTLLHDLKGIFFFADNGSMPVAVLTPLLFIGLVSIMVLLLRRIHISESDSRILFLCVCTILGVFLAYMRSVHTLQTSDGIAPDIRYLAPMYIPGGIIGLIGMKYWKYCPLNTTLWKKSLIYIFIGAPILLIGMLLIQPFGGGFFWYNYTLSLCSFGLLFILLIQYFMMEFCGRWNTWGIRTNILLLLVVPIAWQVMMVFLFSMAKFNGYSFWIPMSEVIVHSFIVPVT